MVGAVSACVRLTWEFSFSVSALGQCLKSVVEGLGTQGKILNKPSVTVETQTHLLKDGCWQGVQAILSLTMLSFHVLKRGLLPLVMTKSAFFSTKNLPVTVLKHSPPFHAYLKV